MMGLSQRFPSFSCELRIIQAQNVEFIKTKSTGNLFARLYLPAGNSRRIQLNSRKVSLSSKPAPFWNESFCLDCSCPQEFLETLKEEQSLVVELRQSNTVLRKIWGSHIVGRAQIPWKAILEAPNMEFREGLKMDPVSRSDCNDVKFRAPELQVEIKIRVASAAETENRRRRLNKWDECGCKHGHDGHAWCSADDYDILSLGAAKEAF